MRLRLRARFIFVLVALLVATFLAIALTIVRTNTHTLRTGLVNQSKSFAALATQPIGDNFVLYKDSGTIRIQQKVDSFTALDKDISQVEIIDTAGHILFQQNDSPTIPVDATAASSLDTHFVYDGKGELTAVVSPYIESFGIHRYAVAYHVSYDGVNQTIRNIVSLIVTLSVAILLVALVVWYLFINRLFLQPVQRISRDSLAISRGDLNRKVHLGRNDEIGDLARAVDTMATSLKDDINKLEELDRTKSEFLMIASHNLRTPLTVMQGYLEEVEDVKTLEEVREMLKPVAANVQRLQGFAEEVLIISSLEVGKEHLKREPTAMEPIIQRVAEEFKKLADQKNLKFITTVTTNASVNIDRSHFHSALWSLLENAYKFTPENGTVELTVMEVGQKLGVAVTDTGIGIDDDEIPKLFTKFHRATDTLQYDYEGMGIGLYLTKLIMQLHGGEVTVQSAKGRGTTFTLWLPMLPHTGNSAVV